MKRSQRRLVLSITVLILAHGYGGRPVGLSAQDRQASRGHANAKQSELGNLIAFGTADSIYVIDVERSEETCLASGLECPRGLI